MKKGLLIILLLSTGLSARSQTVFLSTSEANLYKMDMSSGITTLVGNTASSIEDIAITPSGTLYGIQTSALITISTTDASWNYTPGVNFVPETCNSLVSDGHGELYTAGQHLWKLDMASGNWIDLGSLGWYSSGGDLSFFNGKLYLATYGTHLLEIELSPLTLTDRGYMFINTPDGYGMFSSGEAVYDQCTGQLINGDSAKLFVCGLNRIFQVDAQNAATTLAYTLPYNSTEETSGAASAQEGEITNAYTDLSFTIPNVFSPNGDLVNDRWMPDQFGSIYCPSGGVFFIYDRWGAAVASGSINDGWDGRSSSGIECAEGTYYYIMQRESAAVPEFTSTGFITLVR